MAYILTRDGPQKYPHPFTKSDYDLMIMAAEKMYPDLFRRLNPRAYPEMSGYYSTKVLASSLMDMIAMMDSDGPHKCPNSSRLIVPALGHLTRTRMPIMFLTDEFVQAIKLSDFPAELDWVNMKMPYEHGIFALPRGTLVHPVDGECAFIIYGRYWKDQEHWPPTTGTINSPISMVHTSFYVCGMFPSAGLWFDTCLTAEHKPTIHINNVFEGGGPEQHFPVMTQFDTDLETDADRTTAAQLAALAFGTILALTARPDLLTQAVHNNTVTNKKSGKRTEFWSPNIIGKHYTSKRSGEGQGTHLSPRLHWRRGHFRNQHYGAGNSQVKVIWLEPQLISAGSE